jgi:hypothetical protein
MNFQQIVLIISFVFLLIFTIVTIYSVAASKKEDNVPAYISNCPDYWSDPTNDGRSCTNTNGYNRSTLSSCSGDFSGSVCEKYKKVLQCPGVIWNGITYGNNNNVKNCKI